MATSSAPTPRIKRFDGANYLAWRNRVYTELLCDELTEIVEKKPTEDIRKKTYGTEKKPLSWSQADARARRIIVENLDDCTLHYAPTDISAYEIWRRLKVTYNRTSYLQHAYLRRRLFNLQFDGKRELSAFFSEFDDVVAEIRSSGGKVGKLDDIEVVVILLASLPSAFSPDIASLGEINENSLVTTEMLKGMLLDFDLKCRDEIKAKKSETAIPDRAGTAFYSASSEEKALTSESRTGANKGRTEEKDEKIRCDYCHREGHREGRCYTKRRDQRNTGTSKSKGEANLGEGGDRQSARPIAFVAENRTRRKEAPKVVSAGEITFVADSGCTKFMINNRSYFSSCQRLATAVPITLADSSSTQATHSGTVEVITNQGKRITFNDVLFVPGLRRNLLSVRKITQQGYQFKFHHGGVEISKGMEALATGFVRNELYFVRFDICSPEAGIGESELSAVVAHRRLGHPGSRSLLWLKKEKKLIFSGEIPEKCEACIRGKQCQLSYPSSSFRTTKPLELVVSDVCQANTVSHDGYEFFVTFMDVHTHFSVVYLLKRKSEVFSKLVEYEAMVRAHFGYGIRSFLCDNGGEFINKNVEDFCKSKGIQVLNSIAYNHQQNGRAERLNRTLEDRGRTLLVESGFPRRFWSEAVLCATYCLNRCPTRSTGRIPAEDWFGREVNYSKMRSFGCVCYSHIPAEKRDNKFDPRSSKGIFVGYAPMGYRIYDLGKCQVIVARNVVFDESKLYADLEGGDTQFRRAESDESSDDEGGNEGRPEEAVEVVRGADESSPRRSSRERRLPSHLDDYEVTIGYVEALLTENPSDPKWKEAMDREMQSMEKFHVWKLVPRTPGMAVIRSKWALQEKVDKLKARLVAVGCDEDNVPALLFSPVVNMTTVKMLLSIVVQRKLKLHQMDVSNAFLHGNLDYEVFMEQAPGYRRNKSLVCKLQKAIYGLKVSPRIWNKCINDYMTSSLHFSRSNNDICFYFRYTESHCIYVLVYVDDLLIASDSTELIADFKRKISGQFNVVDLGACTRFLGMEINYNEPSKVMTICQSSFIEKLAKKFNVENSKVIYTPLEVDLDLRKSEKCNVNVPFRQLVGCLLYVSIISRPDIAYAINFFSRYMNCFDEEHFNYLKRVLAYLFHTRHLKLTYKISDESSPLCCYVDADWAADRSDRRSISGSVVLLFNNVIMWRSKKQGSVALSSTESEYISLSTFVHDSMFWVREILKEFKVVVASPIVIFEDNQSVISLSENPLTSKRSKHIDVRFHYVKELVLDRQIMLKYVPTDHQLADGFTKSLVKVKYLRFRDLLNLR